jgi:hypothetical protein
MATIALSTVSVRKWCGSGRARRAAGISVGLSVDGVRDGGWVTVLLVDQRMDVAGRHQPWRRPTTHHPCFALHLRSNTLPHQKPSHL